MASVTNSTERVWANREIAEDGLAKLTKTGWLRLNEGFIGGGKSFTGASGTTHRTSEAIIAEITEIAKSRNLVVNVELQTTYNHVYDMDDHSFTLTLEGKTAPWKQSTDT